MAVGDLQAARAGAITDFLQETAEPIAQASDEASHSAEMWHAANYFSTWAGILDIAGDETFSSEAQR